ncbi:hypothetical protein MCAL160_0627 [Mycoplasmopsis californica HAZ160_1]|uniref:Uncharacterized protein n=1 Tax=Mycoplasmopsis californica HAZ160_1 TaxID=1397850 RepID=A0AAT9F8B5_9BACT|nr:hypothetical protein [Mycoplasmopsis californica]BAP01119.1 hypothetical protein MCAL160_0627 [Mycoplasmopsis californica HAZ160_1]BBG42754.1 hypothetical protein MCAL160E_0627 [Mycoplasmopsis californica]BBG43329.1 hypothetical protein MCAL160L_0627 [Mycoplasmopsis californica]
MSKNKQITLGALSILGSISAVGTTLFVLSQRDEEIANNAIARYIAFSSEFNKNIHNIFSSQKDIEKWKQKDVQIRAKLQDKSLTPLQKYVLLHEIGQEQEEIIFKWINAQILEAKFNPYTIKIIRNLLEEHSTRIQDKDLLQRFKNISLTDTKSSLNKLVNENLQTQLKWINEYKNALDSTISEQFSLIKLHLLQTNNSLDDNVSLLKTLYPTRALRYKWMQNVYQIENDLFNETFRINVIAKNKASIEYALKDAKTQKNKDFNNKYTLYNHEMVETVNLNVVYIGETIAKDSFLGYSLEKNVKDELNKIVSALKPTNTVLVNRGIIDKLIHTINNSIKENNLSKILEYELVKNYLNLSRYYLESSTSLLDSSANISDLENALNDFRNAKKMIEATQLSANEIVVQFKEFVSAYKNSFIHFKKIFLSIQGEKDYTKILAGSFSDTKSALIQHVGYYRDLINRLYVSERMLSQTLNNLENLSSSHNSLITSTDLAKFKAMVFDIIQSAKNPNSAIEKINKNINAIETLIETRETFSKINDEINAKIINWNSVNPNLKARYLSPNVIQLSTDLLNKISEHTLDSNFDANKIIEEKNNVREQLRVIQKIQLLYLETKTSSDLQSLDKFINLSYNQLDSKNREYIEKYSLDTKKLTNLLNEINVQTHKITSVKFNPITSDQIQAQIDKYIFAVNALERALVHNKNLIGLIKAKEYAQKAFNRTQNSEHQYTLAQKSYLNNLQKLIEQHSNFNTDINLTFDTFLHKNTDSISKKLNDLASIFKYEDFDKLDKKSKHILDNNVLITQKAEIANDAIEELKKARQDIITSHDDPDSFKVEFAKIDKLEKDLIKTLEKNNPSSSEIDSLGSQAQNLLNKIIKMRKDGSLLLKLTRAKQKIDQLWPSKQSASEKISEEERNIRALWEKLYKQAQNPQLTKEDKLKLHAKANALVDLLDKVKELETKFNQYKQKEAKYGKSNHGGPHTPQAIANAQGLKDEVQSVLSSISLNDIPPKRSKIDELIKKVGQADSNLELAYGKDKIEAVIKKLEKLRISENSANDHSINKFNDSIEKLIQYGREKTNTDSVLDANVAQQVMSKELELIEVIAQALKVKKEILADTSISSQESKLDADVIARVIEQNLPSVSTGTTDTPETIENKLKKVQNAVLVTEKKHILRKNIINSLGKILSEEEKEWKLYSDLKTKINDTEREFRNILDSDVNSYSPAEIEAKQAELDTKINELLAQKGQINNQYNEAKNNAEEKRDELAKRVATDKKLDPNAKYNNYEKALTEFENDLADRKNSTPESLKNKIANLTSGYYKDIAVNAYEKYKKFTESSISPILGDSGDKIKKLVSDFKSNAENVLRGNFNDQQANNFTELVQSFARYNETQKDIADFIKELESDIAKGINTDEKNKAIPQLKLLLESQYQPTKPYTIANIAEKQAEIYAKWKQIHEQYALRSENKAKANKLWEYFDNFRKVPENTINTNTKRQQADKLLSEIVPNNGVLNDTVDQEVSDLTKVAFDKVLDSNVKASNLGEIKKISAHLDNVDELKDYVNALALQLGNAVREIEKTQVSASPLIDSYIFKYLNDLVSSSRNQYSNLANLDKTKEQLKSELAQKIKDLGTSKELISKVKQLDKLANDVKGISSSTNYNSLNGFSGEFNKEIVSDWVDKLLVDAFYDSKNQNADTYKQKVSEATEKVNKAKLYLEKQKEVANKILEWQKERKTDLNKFNSTKKDEDKMIQAMWDTLKQVSEISPQNIDQIDGKIQSLSQELDKNEKIRAERIKTYEALQRVKSNSKYSELSQFPSLLSLVEAKLKSLEKQIEKADDNPTLQKIQQEANNIATSLELKLKLAAKIKELYEFSNKTTPLNENIENYEKAMISELEKASKLLENGLSENNTNNLTDEIDKTILDLDKHKAKIDAFQEWAKIDNEIKNDEIISLENRKILNAKSEEFKKELEKISSSHNADKTKYDEINQKYNNSQAHTADSIPFLLDIARKLTLKINEAKAVLETNKKVDGEDVSSSEVDKAYETLKQLIDSPKSQINGDISEKEKYVKDLENAIDDIVRKKLLSTTELRDQAQGIEAYIQTSDDFKNNKNILGQDFVKKSIDNLTDIPIKPSGKPVEEINNANKLISEAIKSNWIAIKTLYDNQQSLLNELNSKLDSTQDSIKVDDIWTNGTKSSYESINPIKQEVNKFLTTKTILDDKLKTYAEFSDQEQSFVNDYLKDFASILQKGKEALTKLKTEINSDLDEVLNNSTGKAHQFIDSIENSLKQRVNDQGADDIFNLLPGSKIIFNQIKDEYDKLKNSFNVSYASELQFIQEKLSNTKQLIQNIDSFYTTLKEEINSLIEKRAKTDEIMNYIFKPEKVEQLRIEIDKIYNAKKDALQEQNNQINKSGFSDFIQDTFINSSISNIFSKILEFRNGMNDPKITQIFQKLLQDNNRNNHEVKPNILLREFKAELEDIASKLKASDQMEISGNNRFLLMFNKFGHTVLDANSPFNHLYLKTYLIKDKSQWYTDRRQNEKEKNIQLKVRYEYKPNNLNIFSDYKGFAHEEPFEISFKNANKLGLEPKSSGIFYNNNNQYGYAIKQKIGNADDLGWQGSDQHTIINKLITKFKEALDINGNGAVVINHSENKVYDVQKNGGSEKLVEKTIQDNKNFNVKFIFPEFHQYQQATFINSDNSKQLVRLSVEDNKIVAKVIVPSNLIVGFLNKDKNLNSVVFDGKVTDDTKAMPSALVNTIKFSFDYDTSTKDIYMYINHYDSYHVVKHMQLFENGYTPIKTYENNRAYAYVWSHNDFARWLAVHTDIWDPNGKNARQVLEVKFKKQESNESYGQEIDNKIIVKNPRTAGKYIFTDYDKDHPQHHLVGVKILPVYSSGIDSFEFIDLKK